MSEIKKPSVYILLQYSNETVLKNFQNMIKTYFPQTHLVCPMKTAIENAVRSKPPLIKMNSTDMLSMTGDLANVVVNNWVSNQLKKPIQKAAPAKKPQAIKKPGKQAVISAVDSTPRIPEPEAFGPTFVYLTEYPRTQEQLSLMISSFCPIICHITLDMPTNENDKKASQQSIPIIDWKAQFPSDFPYLSYMINPATTNEELSIAMISEIHTLSNAFSSYKSETTDIRLIDIPQYPPAPVHIPQLQTEKPPSKASIQAPKNQVIPPPEPLLFQISALTNAYKLSILQYLKDYIITSGNPSLDTIFVHHFETLPKYPLPSYIRGILSKNQNLRSHELFTFRSVSFKNNIPFDHILHVHIIKEFEKLLGYSIGERRYIEHIPLDFVPFVLSPLLSDYTDCKYTEFCGLTLLSFSHPIPSKMPIIYSKEKMNLPIYQGFGKWASLRNDFSSIIEESFPQTEIGVSAGSIDQFCGILSSESEYSKEVYYCESGLKVQSYPLQSLPNGQTITFIVYYNNLSKISFTMTQQSMSDQNEEEDNIEVISSIRGAFNPKCQFCFDYSSTNNKFSVFSDSYKVEFDSTNNKVILSGSNDESQRIIQSNGNLIKFDPNSTIYRIDGSITKIVNNEWHHCDKNGQSFIKKQGQWYRNPSQDASEEIIKSYFCDRQVVKRSNGVTLVKDTLDSYIVFPDGTKYSVGNSVYSHPCYPDIQVSNGSLIIQTNEYIVTYDENRNFTLESKDGEASLSYIQDTQHLIFSFGQFKNVMTMVDLVTGTVANVGARRSVYYLNDEWKWKIGRQLCSKKEIVQHFQEGDFVERLQPIDQMDNEELRSVISQGHKPRLFIIEKIANELNVRELISSNDYQNAAESSENRVSQTDESKVTLWFDTKPKSYREISIFPKISDDVISSIFKLTQKEIEYEKSRESILNSVGDPKWRDLEKHQMVEENNILQLLSKYGISMMTN